MGLLSFVNSLFNLETLGESIVSTQEKTYRKVFLRSPRSDPHELLAEVWLSRMAARGKNINTPNMQTAAFTETMQFACVSPTQNARALGLFFLYKERPDIIRQFPKFSNEFEALMKPVQEVLQDGSFDRLYANYNPRMSSKFSS